MREDATDEPDVDVIVVGGDRFRTTDIFAFGEELRELTQKDVDVFEIREINENTSFYNSMLQ